MGNEAISLSSQAAAVRVTLDRFEDDLDTRDWLRLKEAEKTLRRLSILADYVRQHGSEDGEAVSEELADQIISLLRLPVVKA